jgi:hypothetical protein
MWSNIVAYLQNHCCNGNASVYSICIVDLHISPATINKKVMKICPVGAKLICADWWTNISKIIGILCKNVNAPNKGLVYMSQRVVFALLYNWCDVTYCVWLVMLLVVVSNIVVYICCFSYECECTYWSPSSHITENYVWSCYVTDGKHIVVYCYATNVT